MKGNAMNHYRQIGNTCFPNTVAMLRGVTPTEVINYGLSWSTHKNWETAYNAGNTVYGEIVKRIMLRYKVPFEIAWTKRSMAVAGPPTLPSGKGAITVIMNRYGHVVAYEDQIVYDSSKEKPMPYLKWLKLITRYGWTITSITPIK